MVIKEENGQNVLPPAYLKTKMIMLAFQCFCFPEHLFSFQWKLVQYRNCQDCPSKLPTNWTVGENSSVCSSFI